jgi:hypothetical protein
MKPKVTFLSGKKQECAKSVTNVVMTVCSTWHHEQMTIDKFVTLEAGAFQLEEGFKAVDVLHWGSA